MDAMPDLPTGKLKFNEWQTLSNLLRRLAMNHVPPNSIWRSEVLAMQGIVRCIYTELYVPAPPPMPPLTVGPNPIPVSELLNQNSVYDSGIAPWNA
jgi:hypothetical protein